jgi:hypothetical protein
MKLIPLTRGKFVMVDDEDYEYLNQWKWYATKSHITFYAERQQRLNPGIQPQKQKNIKMHRLIMNTSQNMQVDHIDHNGLNNQKSNLRNCTLSQNARNRKARGKSKYLGVYFYGENLFRADIRPSEHKTIHLGLFKSEIDAARAYDNEAKKYYGEFANLNFK